MKHLTTMAISALALVAVGSNASAQDWQGEWQGEEFTVASSDFENGGTLPISAIYNYQMNGMNACSINGSAGGDVSPELHWKHAPRDTRSFAVIVYDATAAVVHWGMYNIAPKTAALPQNAGVAGSTYGEQVTNVFGDQSYDGPCPPAGFAPDTHRYIFTVYALDVDLKVYSTANFPPSALTLYRDLLKAERFGHVLASASVTGLYSATPVP